MKLASIVPMKNVDRTFDGDYAMLLTHLAEYYPTHHPSNCYVIMDNSLIELGEAASIEATYRAAVRCNANEIILPDVFMDYPGTIKSVRESLEWLRNQNRKFKLMAVCHGKDMIDFRKCFRELCAMPEIYCIGIPKVADKLSVTGRPAFESLWQDCSKVIHLLGCWASLREFKCYAHPELIRSCDTCIPALLSTKGIHDAYAYRPEKTIDLLRDSIDPIAYDDILTQLREDRFV